VSRVVTDLVAGAGLKFSSGDRTNLRVPWQIGSVCCEYVTHYWHMADVGFSANDGFAPEAAVRIHRNLTRARVTLVLCSRFELS
jgi:hypothetical protein